MRVCAAPHVTGCGCGATPRTAGVWLVCAQVLSFGSCDAEVPFLGEAAIPKDFMEAIEEVGEVWLSLVGQRVPS